MLERNETQRRESDITLRLRREEPCLGNGCGDFGFIEDLATLIAIKLLVDDSDAGAMKASTSPLRSSG